LDTWTLGFFSAVGSEPRIIPDQSPTEALEFFLLPGGSTPIPMIAVRSGGQSVDWIARNAIGWMTYHREPETQRTRHSMWRAAVERVAPGEFRAFGVAMALDLAANVDEPAQERSLGYRTGRRDLVKVLREMRDTGTHHVTLNLQASGRPTREIPEELAADVLPEFQTADES
jgi:luciferase-type oxidoreductase